MQRGNVVRFQLPRPKGRAGREQFGTRPAVVLQSNRGIANISTVIIVPLTSNLSAKNFDGSFIIEPVDGNGLRMDSVALTHQVRAIDKSRVEDVIGALTPKELERLESEMRDLLGL